MQLSKIAMIKQAGFFSTDLMFRMEKATIIVAQK
jgi:hypothetical protein